MIKRLWRSIVEAMTMPPVQVAEVKQRARKVRRATWPHGFRINRNDDIVPTTRVYCCRDLPTSWSATHQ